MTVLDVASAALPEVSAASMNVSLTGCMVVIVNCLVERIASLDVNNIVAELFPATVVVAFGNMVLSINVTMAVFGKEAVMLVLSAMVVWPALFNVEYPTGGTWLFVGAMKTAAKSARM